MRKLRRHTERYPNSQPERKRDTMPNLKSKIEQPPDGTPALFKAIRVKLGYNQPDWAKAVGVTVMTISRWENGHSKPLPMAMRAIQRVKAKRDR